MAVQTNTREIKVGELDVICRELTVMQVRAWLQSYDPTATIDVVAAFLFPDCTLDEIKRMTDLTDDRINELKPSQVQEVIAVCKELNPHFFAMQARLAPVSQLQPKA